MILSFFLILVSFWSNIKENSWEFGVLRALGLTKTQMTKIYVYEALVLIITAGLLGKNNCQPIFRNNRRLSHRYHYKCLTGIIHVLNIFKFYREL